jgi:hypothetical protein
MTPLAATTIAVTIQLSAEGNLPMLPIRQEPARAPEPELAWEKARAPSNM